MTALVIGVGNPLRGDDGAGPAVAAAVAARRPDLTCLATHQLVPELADAIARAGAVVFVDASVRVAEPTVTTVAPDAAVRGTHVSAPGALLALARDLYGAAPRAAQVEVPARNLGFGAELSPATARDAAAAVDLVLGLVTRP